MTLQYKGGARFPGPLGISPGILGGRLPGPLRFGQVDLAKGGATKASKTLIMPPPTKGSSTIMRLRTVSWKLSNRASAWGDVQQGALANCPIAAILAALAHTDSGRERLDRMITEYLGAPVETTLSAEVMTLLSSKEQEGDNPDYTPQVKTLRSNRYFAVTLGKNTFEVSDAFYVKETGQSGGDVDLVYMDSPTPVLWPCVIEKAYAVKLKSYEELDDQKHTVEEFWEVLVGKKPVVIRDGNMTEQKIRAAAMDASKVPTIGATRDEVPKIDKAGATRVDSDHGYAVLGIQGSTIELYNPWGKTQKIPLKEFKSNFEAIYYGNP
jgi:Calpain family cysteine protease